MTSKSTEILKTIIRKEFDSIDFSMDFIYGKADELIEVANELGLNDLAIELTIDKRVEI